MDDMITRMIVIMKSMGFGKRVNGRAEKSVCMPKMSVVVIRPIFMRWWRLI